ncbi:MAG: hypothetical protein C0432_05715 [Candidatus Puniceispirillum sp.]|nr:hypothetical protein [Candidatus Puniceispirillum sp.]
MSKGMRGTLPSKEFSSFSKILSYRAQVMPDAQAFVFYNEDGDGKEVPVSYADLYMRVVLITNQLSKNINPGERCLLLYKPGIEYIAAFFACLYARVIAVPVFLSNKERQIEKLEQIITNCSPKAILSMSHYGELLEYLISNTNFGLMCLYSDTFGMHQEKCFQSIDSLFMDLNDVAFLQYSSGSTGNPKGVQITHKNLFVNTEAIFKNFSFNKDSKGIIWLPPYHDMGLIGGVLASIYGGIELVLTPPSTFVRNPLNWLNLISTQKGTISGGPNFAYDMCIKQMQRRPNKNLDLSSWKVAFCGAEPIFPDTIHRFIETFSPYGFDKNAFFPCYGLAEATLMVSCRQTQNPVTKHFSREKWLSGIIEKSNDVSEDAIEVVNCGEVISGHRVCIVDPKTRNLKSDEIGEIWIHGPSVSKGYWENKEENLNLFSSISNCETKDNSWLRTGDLGFLLGNELFISGRIKDLLIVNGLNYYLQDIEKEVEDAHPAVIASVAFSSIEDGSEKLIIAIEIKERDLIKNGDLIEVLVRRAVSNKYKLFVQKIVFVKAKSIPKTTSGKKQRSLSKNFYLNGGFEIYSNFCENNHDLAKDIDNEAIYATFARFLGIEKKQLIHSNSLLDFGLDSVKIMELKYKLEEQFHVDLEHTDFLTEFNLTTLVERVKLAPKIQKKHDATYQDISHIPLTPLQNALWVTYTVEPQNLAYNVSRCFIVEQLNIRCFSEAIEQVVTEQVSLRSTFCAIEGEVFQKIHTNILPGTFNFQKSELLEESNIKEKFNLLTKEAFDLESGPLFKVYIYQVSLNKSLLVFCAHHIIVDFWSISILVKRVAQLYADLSTKKFKVNLPYHSAQVGLKYSDFYRNYLMSAQYLDDLAFWQRQYETLPSKKIQNMYVSKPKALFSLYEFSFTQQQATDFKNFCVQNHISEFNFSLLIFGILLCMLNKTNDVSIGLPLAIRDAAYFSDYIGYCANLLPIRIQIDEFTNTNLFINELKSLIFLIRRHKNFPFTHLMEKIKFPRRTDNKLPIVDAVFLYQSSQHIDGALALCAINSSKGQFNLSDAIFKMQPFSSHDNQIELTLNVTSLNNSVDFVVEYANTVYSSDHIQNFSEVYTEIFNFLIRSNSMQLSEILEDKQLAEWLSTLLNKAPDNDESDLASADADCSETEIKLLEIWQEILQNSNVKRDDNFFALGGSSLLAVKLASKIDHVFEVKTDIRNIFRYQSAKELANYISGLPKVNASSSIQVIKRVAFKGDAIENNP